MGTLKDPVGPEQKSVYRRRRLLVLVGLLAVIAAVVLIIVKPGSSGGAARAPEVALPEEIVAGEKPSDEPVADELQPCPVGQLEVTALINQDSFASGEQPQVGLRVQNIGEAACHADLGTSTMSFRITSGSDEVWRSTDCQEKADSRPVILEPGAPLETELLTWDRTRSSTETCSIARDQVGAGGATYHLHASIAGASSQSTAPFLLY
ncbi:MAG: hypothetical protein GX814_06965 [Microbacteriaceae bacterium]|nr:hypothetical protein [Microbacteriaceae bacterium]